MKELEPRLTLKPLHDVNDRFYQNFPKYQKFEIKKDGVVIGRLEWKSRYKNAGGDAWNATIEASALPPKTDGFLFTGSVKSYWNKDREKLLANVRAVLEGRDIPHPEPLEPAFRPRYY